MTIVLRPAHADEAPALSALCLRSKAHWGYDAAFMRACVAELILRPEDLTPDTLVVAEIDNALAGMAQVGPPILWRCLLIPITSARTLAVCCSTGVSRPPVPWAHPA